MADTTQPSPSPTERRVHRLLAHRRFDVRPEERIDWIHDADLDHVLDPTDHR